MKQTITLLLLLVATGAFAQFSKEDNEITDIINAQDSLPRSMFLDAELLPDMTVKVYNTSQVWSSVNKTDKHLKQLFDIRIKFADKAAALAFHKKYIKQNSEGGPEITDYHIKHKGADDFRVFKGERMINDMMAKYGLQMFCYLFVVDNYFVKVYITCSKDYAPDKFENLIADVIKRVKKL